MDQVSCTNTHNDVTDLVNHGMVKNRNTWISWERNIIFLWNKKTLNLCLRWNIQRSYCFVVEVTFKNTYFEEHLQTAGSTITNKADLVMYKLFKGNAQFVQRVNFESLMGFKQNHYGRWKYYKSCNFKFFSPKS